MSNVVELQGLRKQFDQLVALDDMWLDVSAGEFVTLLGASGCGKTTTIRIIAGYESPTSGSVHLKERDVTRVPAQKRGVGMVFQNYALFPHMSVFDNIAYSMRVRKRSRRAIVERVEQLVEVTKLTGFERHKPRQLSGGMQQRVALARALASDPDVLLMDEPLSALDVKLRRSMRVELKRLQREFGVTTIYVTHDQTEALSMSDRIVVMDKGKIMQVGSPAEIYHRPASDFVADFVGWTNLCVGRISAGGDNTAADMGLTTILLPSGNERVGQPVKVSIRPEVLTLSEASESVTADNSFDCTISSFQFMGGWDLTTVNVPALEQELLIETRFGHWKEGQRAVVSWGRDDSVVIPLDDAPEPLAPALPKQGFVG